MSRDSAVSQLRMRRTRSRQLLMQALRRKMLQEVDDILPISYAQWTKMNEASLGPIRDYSANAISSTRTLHASNPAVHLDSNQADSNREKANSRKFAIKMLPRHSKSRAREQDTKHATIGTGLTVRTHRRSSTTREAPSVILSENSTVPRMNESNYDQPSVLMYNKPPFACPDAEEPRYTSSLTLRCSSPRRYIVNRVTCRTNGLRRSELPPDMNNNFDNLYTNTELSTGTNTSSSHQQRPRPIPVPVQHLPDSHGRGVSSSQMPGRTVGDSVRSGGDRSNEYGEQSHVDLERKESRKNEQLVNTVKVCVVLPKSEPVIDGSSLQPEIDEPIEQLKLITHDKSLEPSLTNVNKTGCVTRQTSTQCDERCTDNHSPNQRMEPAGHRGSKADTSTQSDGNEIKRSLARKCILRHLSRLPLAGSSSVLLSSTDNVEKPTAKVAPTYSKKLVTATPGSDECHSSGLARSAVKDDGGSGKPADKTSIVETDVNIKGQDGPLYSVNTEPSKAYSQGDLTSSETSDEDFTGDVIKSVVFTASSTKTSDVTAPELRTTPSTPLPAKSSGHATAQEGGNKRTEMMSHEPDTRETDLSFSKTEDSDRTRSRMKSMEIDRLTSHTDLMTEPVGELDAFPYKISRLTDQQPDIQRFYRFPSQDELDFEDTITDFCSSLDAAHAANRKCEIGVSDCKKTASESASRRADEVKSSLADTAKPVTDHSLDCVDSVPHLYNGKIAPESNVRIGLKSTSDHTKEQPCHPAHSHVFETNIHAVPGPVAHKDAPEDKPPATEGVKQKESKETQKTAIESEKNDTLHSRSRFSAAEILKHVESNHVQSGHGNTVEKVEPTLKIPKFYFPGGQPRPSDEIKSTIKKINSAFASSGKDRLSLHELGSIAQACGYSTYWKAPIFKASVKSGEDTVCCSDVVSMWKRVASSCHDDASRFVKMLAKQGKSHLEFHDFLALMQDIVECHPGLIFLREAPEFHTRYMNTVIARIFYMVNRSWSGQITVTELRRSNFLSVLNMLEDEDDINAVTDFFSYEHFYVIYCKFWELDTDHNLVIDKLDLLRHANGALSSRLVDRVLCGAVTRWDSSDHRTQKMSYVDFVWFLISEEDKKSQTSIEYWFRCMDLDGDGVISMYEMEFFYEEQMKKLEQLDIEPLPFEDCICQMLDMVKPSCSDYVTLKDLKNCKMAHVFFDTFFNVEKYLDHEQKDPFAPQKDVDSSLPEPSDWEKYAADEYEILVAEEQANEHAIDMSYDDEVDPLIEEEFQKLGLAGSAVGQDGPITDVQVHRNPTDNDHLFDASKTDAIFGGYTPGLKT